MTARPCLTPIARATHITFIRTGRENGHQGNTGRSHLNASFRPAVAFTCSRPVAAAPAAGGRACLPDEGSGHGLSR